MSTTTADVRAIHVSLTARVHGADRNVHLIDNPDLALVLERAERERRHNDVPTANTGYVVVAADVDNDHDEVHLSMYAEARLTEAEMLDRAIAVLTASRDVLRKLDEL